MPILSIRHVTRYRYRNPVALGEHRMMLRPRESYDQRILSYDLVIYPTPERLRSVHDVFGNCVSVAGFSGRTEELIFDSQVRLDHTPLPAFADVEGEVEVYTGAMPFDYSPEDLPDLELSMQRHYPDPEGLIDAWARRFVKPVGRTSLQTLLSDMTQAIYAEFKYNSRLALGIQDRLGDPGPAQRNLPRLRRPDDGGGPQPRPRGPFRLGLHLQSDGGGRIGPRQRRPHPRLGAGLPAGLRLGGVRSYQRHCRQRRSCACRHSS